MSVLSRIVDRATGEATANLRPRLPSRFEPSALGIETPGRETGDLGVNDGRPAATLTADTAGPAVVASAERAPPRTNEPGRVSEPPAPRPRVSSSDRVKTEPPPAHDPPAPHLPPGPEERVAVSFAADAVPPPTDAGLSGRPKPSPVPAASPPDDPQRLSPSRPATERSEPPVALLEPEPIDHGDRIAETVAVVAPPSVAPAPAAPEPVPPDITIHIGRLDLQTGPQKPAAKPRRRAPTFKPDSLADYLKGSRV